MYKSVTSQKSCAEAHRKLKGDILASSKGTFCKLKGDILVFDICRYKLKGDILVFDICH